MAVPSQSPQIREAANGLTKQSESRWESDSLGRVELPGSALYGIQTARALACMTFSGSKLVQYPDLIVSLATVKKACASANRDANVLSPEICDVIQHACEEVIGGLHNQQFAATPSQFLHHVKSACIG